MARRGGRPRGRRSRRDSLGHMSHSANADEFIVAEWRAALSDAGVNENDFHLIICPGAPTPDHPKAVSFARHHVVTTAESDGEIIATQAKLDEAAQHDAVNRVATFEDWDEDDPVEMARLAGLLRHEIEHGRQRDDCPNSFDLYDLTAAIIRHAVQDGRNFRELFHLQPVEWDADAAASMYLRGHPVHQTSVSDLLDGADTYLVRSELPPGNTDALVARTVGFLYSLREACLKQEQFQTVTFDQLIDGMISGTGHLWRTLDAATLC